MKKGYQESIYKVKSLLVIIPIVQPRPTLGFCLNEKKSIPPG